MSRIAADRGAAPARTAGTPRREVLAGALALGAAAAGFAWLSRGGAGFGAPGFEPVPGVPGLRRIAGQARITGLPAATIGLGGTAPASPPGLREATRAALVADPLGTIHGASPQGTAGGVPATYFTAGGCPLCPVLSGLLAGLGVIPAHRPLGLFGPASVRAARAIEAAGRLEGASAAGRLHDRLVGTPFETGDAYIAAVAAEEGLDVEQLLPAMDAPETDAALALNHALASALALPGTPAIVLGSTLAIGLPSRGTLREILAAEAA